MKPASALHYLDLWGLRYASQALNDRRHSPAKHCSQCVASHWIQDSAFLHVQLPTLSTMPTWNAYHLNIYIYIHMPVVLHKAEVSEIGNYRRGALLWCMDGRANPLMERKAVAIFGVVAVATSPRLQDVVGCSEAQCNGSCSCSRSGSCSCDVVVVVM